MTYNPFVSSWMYNPYQSFTFFNPQYAYPTFESFQAIKPFIQNEISQTIDANNISVSIRPQIEISDKRRNEIHVSEENKGGQVKKSNERKIKKKGRNTQKQLESAKKNCESNLVNQFLSYFSSISNSFQLIVKALKKMRFQALLVENTQFEDIVTFFCKQVSIVNSRKERKYVNRAFLQHFFFQESLQKQMPDILQNVQKSELLTKSQFCELFRKCCFHFFRTVSLSSVISSSKLNPISRPEHIKRRRLIVESLNQK